METEPNAATPAAADPPIREIEYPGFFLSSVLHIALLLAMFLVALDMVSLAQQDAAGHCDADRINDRQL